MRTRSGSVTQLQGLVTNSGLVTRLGLDSAELAAARLVKVPRKLCPAAALAKKATTAGSWGWPSG